MPSLPLSLHVAGLYRTDQHCSRDEYPKSRLYLFLEKKKKGGKEKILKQPKIYNIK